MSAAAASRSADSAQLLDELLSLRDIAGEVAAIDVADVDGDRSTGSAVAEALCGMLERALGLLAEIQRADGSDDDVSIPELEPLELDAWGEAGSSSARGPRIGDVCFAGALELRRVLRELAATRIEDATSEERLVAVDNAQRKLRRAIRAVLETAREAGVHDVLGGEHRGHHQVSDLASGLAVRRLYARFRRALRRPADDTPEAVLAAVRYAGGALAMLVADPDSADIRASDRAVLRGLRERALRWARGDRAVPAGLQLLDDMWTCSDLLRGINRRQELRVHDAAAIAACVAGPEQDPAAWIARLDTLCGLDDRVDALVERLRASLHDSAQFAGIASETCARLRQVRR